MKNIIYITLAVLTITTSFAQNGDNGKQQKASKIEYRHEFRAGYGVPLPLEPNSWEIIGENNIEDNYWYRTTRGDSGLYSFYYGYRIIRGLKVTATLSYYNFERPYYNGNSEDNDRTEIGTWEHKNYRFSPAIQYEWYNRGLVTLYSEVGITFNQQYVTETIRGDQTKFSELQLRANVTPIGITVGRKLFGYAEVLSFGPRGLFNAGIGYRF